jgi:multimeric flavodoxin WrbA
MTKKPLVILGTAGEGEKILGAIRELSPFTDFDLVDLATLNIGHYDYDHSKNEGDDFHAAAQKMVDADVIVFATPVYWYAMSGLMKVFFDRLTELLYDHKSMGRALKGKKTFLVVTGSRDAAPDGFDVPFRLTAEYFGMSFEGMFYRKTI